MLENVGQPLTARPTLLKLVAMAQERYPPASGRRVAISDPLPAFRTGLAQALSKEGFAPEEPCDLLAWTKVHKPCAAIVTLGQPEDLDLIVRLTTHGRDLHLLVLCDQPPSNYLHRLIGLGCYSFADRFASPHLIAKALQMTMENYGVAPVEVASSVTGVLPKTDCPSISACEIGLLETLATGAHVAQLAADKGYSEREMYRVLKRLYRRLDVSNRSQALVTAVRHGLI